MTDLSLRGYIANHLYELHSINQSGAKSPSLLLDEHVRARRDPAQRQLVEGPIPVGPLGPRVRELDLCDIVSAGIGRPLAVGPDLVAGLEVCGVAVVHA